MGAGHQPCRRSLSRCLFSRFNSAPTPRGLGKRQRTALNAQLARQAGLSFMPDTDKTVAFSQWRLPLVVELRDGQLLVIEHVNGEDAVDVFVIEEEGQRNRLTSASYCRDPLCQPRYARYRHRDSRVDRYISRFKPDWRSRFCRIFALIYRYVAAFLINVPSRPGIVFSMQVYDGIPAQSYPTLWSFFLRRAGSGVARFSTREARTQYWRDVLGKRADMRISDGYSVMCCCCATALSPFHRQFYLAVGANWSRTAR